jgi:N,N'-diacetyllegionaminate synthase
MSKVLSIIPARGGSKGLPRKNIAVLGGRPLIAYSIESALRSKWAGKVVVSTEDIEISKVSRRYGADVLDRPEELAKDESSTISVVMHVLKTLEEDGYVPEVVVLLQPTTPLRTSQDIDAAVDLFMKSDCDSVVSVCEMGHSPYWSFEDKNGYLMPLFGEEYLHMRRQDLPPVYLPNGALFISRPEMLYRAKSFYSSRTLPYIMPPERSIDIDSATDLAEAELILKSQTIKVGIGSKMVGEGEPCFIIAEAGVNHNGSLEYAKKMIDTAKLAGADAVKFQNFTAEEIATSGAEKAEYQRETTCRDESQYDMLKKLELQEWEFRNLADYAKARDIIFMSTPFSSRGVDALEKIGVPAYKIASGEITNFPLLEYIAKKGKPVILSTGMSTLDEIDEALNTLRSAGAKEIILLHCITSYPAKMEEVNLTAMALLKSTFGLPIGLSDHTLGITAPIAAVALGACVIEKHFTLDRNLPGPDQKASLEPSALKALVTAVRDVEKALGNGFKQPTEDEEKIRLISRRSIVAGIEIPKGAILTEGMLALKRPGTGIAPKDLKKLVGKKAKKTIPIDHLIAWDMVER